MRTILDFMTSYGCRYFQEAEVLLCETTEQTYDAMKSKMVIRTDITARLQQTRGPRLTRSKGFHGETSTKTIWFRRVKKESMEQDGGGLKLHLKLSFYRALEASIFLPECHCVTTPSIA